MSLKQQKNLNLMRKDRDSERDSIVTDSTRFMIKIIKLNNYSWISVELCSHFENTLAEIKANLQRYAYVLMDVVGPYAKKADEETTLSP